MINIAIIDDGVSDCCFYINSIKEHIIVDNETVLRNSSAVFDKYSHGSICAAILCSKSDEFGIISISMKYDKVLCGYNINSLITSLKLCLNLDIDFIHLSLGIMDTSYYYEILEIINALSEKGVIIVAAADLSEKLTIPACYSNVFGVMYSPYVKNSKGYRYISNSISGVDVLVNVDEKIKMKNGTFSFFQGASSYAVPVICYEISKLLSQSEKNNIIKAKHGIIREKNIDWINSPLIIVFSQEEEKIDRNLVIFNTYTVLNITNLNADRALLEYCEAYAKSQDIIIVDNFDNEENLVQFFTNHRDSLSVKNIALLSDSTRMVEFFKDLSKGRLYLSMDLSSKVLIQNVANSEVKIIEEVCKGEIELRQIIIKHPNCLFVSFEKLHIIYGIDYIPLEIQKTHNLLYNYISKLAYIYGKNNVCIIKNQ